MWIILRKNSFLYTISAFLIALLIITIIVFVINMFMKPKEPIEDVLGVTDTNSGDITNEPSGDHVISGDNEEIIEEYIGPEVFSGDSRSVAVMTSKNLANS